MFKQHSAFDPESLAKELEQLSQKKRLAFALSCCERLVPNYRKFYSETKWGDVDRIKGALDFLWGGAGGKKLTDEEIAWQIRCCETCAPDADDFDSLYVSSAQDACLALCQVLDYLQDHNIEHLVKAVAYALDSVDLYVQEIEDMEPNTADLEKRILAHTLMQKELDEEYQALKQIGEISEDNTSAWATFLNRWRNPEQGCLGV